MSCLFLTVVTTKEIKVSTNRLLFAACGGPDKTSVAIDVSNTTYDKSAGVEVEVLVIKDKGVKQIRFCRCVEKNNEGWHERYPCRRCS